VLEHETLLDKAMIDYANKLEQGSTRLQDVAANPSRGEEISCNLPPLPKGWALKTTLRKRFTAVQTDYLRKKFNIGRDTGRKQDPSTVAKEMRRAKDADGNRLFPSSKDFLTSQQIAKSQQIA
jgi:hypothetical protein